MQSAGGKVPRAGEWSWREGTVAADLAAAIGVRIAVSTHFSVTTHITSLPSNRRHPEWEGGAEIAVLCRLAITADDGTKERRTRNSGTGDLHDHYDDADSRRQE